MAGVDGGKRGALRGPAGPAAKEPPGGIDRDGRATGPRGGPKPEDAVTDAERIILEAELAAVEAKREHLARALAASAAPAPLAVSPRRSPRRTKGKRAAGVRPLSAEERAKLTDVSRERARQDMLRSGGVTNG